MEDQQKPNLTVGNDGTYKFTTQDLWVKIRPLEKHYPLYVQSPSGEKLLVVQSMPEQKITLKGVEITMERFIELLETLQP